MPSLGLAATAPADTATAAIIMESCLIFMKMLLEVRYCIVFASKTRIPLSAGRVKAAGLEALLGICRTVTFSISCIFFHGRTRLLAPHNSP
jgi:hypothetical protein